MKALRLSWWSRSRGSVGRTVRNGLFLLLRGGLADLNPEARLQAADDGAKRLVLDPAHIIDMRQNEGDGELRQMLHLPLPCLLDQMLAKRDAYLLFEFLAALLQLQHGPLDDLLRSPSGGGAIARVLVLEELHHDDLRKPSQERLTLLITPGRERRAHLDAEAEVLTPRQHGVADLLRQRHGEIVRPLGIAASQISQVQDHQIESQHGDHLALVGEAAMQDHRPHRYRDLGAERGRQRVGDMLVVEQFAAVVRHQYQVGTGVREGMPIRQVQLVEVTTLPLVTGQNLVRLGQLFPHISGRHGLGVRRCFVVISLLLSSVQTTPPYLGDWATTHIITDFTELSMDAYNTLMQKKTIILHDYLQHKGGGERLILTLARALKTTLVVGFRAPGAFDPADFGVDCVELGHEVHYPGFRYFAIQRWFRRRTKFLAEYDTAIFSANCIQAARNAGPNTRTIFYCHTPIRNAYDLYEYYVSRMPWWKAIAYRVFCALIRFNYERDLKNIDVIVANSKTIQDRIKTYLKRDSVIVYPPIDTKKFDWIGQKDYYLSYARIDLVKRVTEIAEAFKRMPDKTLVIASTGTEVERLKELIKDAPNIKYLGRVSDDDLHQLVGNCIANIYIPRDEDFGMTVLEGMAAGKPCLGVAEGGLRETIEHEKDGYLLPANPSVDDIVTGVTYLSPARCFEMKLACQKKANQFREELFVEKMKAVIEGKSAV